MDSSGGGGGCQCQCSTGPGSVDDEYADEVNRAVLRRLVARAGQKLRHVDVSALVPWVGIAGVVKALTGQGLEGQLESLRVDGVDIKADLSSLAAFKRAPTIVWIGEFMTGILFSVVDIYIDTSVDIDTYISSDINRARWDDAGHLLAMGDLENGTPPDERFVAYLDNPPPANLSAAVAIYLERTHAKLASFLRRPRASFLPRRGD